MNVVISVNGREAIPVRALPFVAPGQMSPDTIVTLMGRYDECGRFDELFAYQLLPFGCSLRVQPIEWNRIRFKVLACDDRIRSKEKSGAITKNIGSDKWNEESIRLLPAGVFVWKDEFTSEHFRDYIQGMVTEDEYGQGGYDPNFEPLIYPSEMRDVVMEGFADNNDEIIDESSTQPVGEIVQLLGKWFDRTIADLPPKLRGIAEAYIPNWSELSVADRRARADEAGLQLQETRGARSEKARSEVEQSDAETPDRFKKRAFLDGFNKVGREKNGERDFEAKRVAVKVSDERCIELAHSHELRIADWTELTGISIGRHESYIISVEDVVFRKWTDDDFSQMHGTEHVRMHRENEIAPLTFPCTPSRLIEYIDAVPPGSHSFTVPDAFRQAVAESAPPTGALAQVADEAQEQTAHSGSTEKAAPEVTPAGITKREILAVDWPLPPNAPPLQNILDNLPKWVAHACTKVGRAGKGPDGSHLWNPAILAVCLATTTPQKRWRVSKKALTNLLSQSFQEYLRQWEKAVEKL